MKIILISFILIHVYKRNILLCSSEPCESVSYPIDPDFNRTVCELVVSAGFQCETHEVTTEDGYILPLFRIVNVQSKELGKPVLLVHGLLANAAYFIIGAPGIGTQFSNVTFNGEIVSQNLGYALSTFGYDVWLISYRGDQYARKHLENFGNIPQTRSLNMTCPQSLVLYKNRMAAVSMPCFAPFINENNYTAKISYVGHSHGSTIVFGLLSDQPKFNDIIDVAFALAPVAIIGNTKSISIQALTIPPVPEALYRLGGPVGLGYEGNSEQSSNFALNCPLFNAFLPSVNMVGAGPSNNLNKSRAHVIYKNFGSDSDWTLSRFLRHPFSFKHFDYGPVKNFLKYGSLTPPVYDLKNIRSKLCLISGSNDYIADQKDIDYIRKGVNPGVIVCDTVYEGLNHLDLGTAAATSTIGLQILQELAKYKY